MEEAGQCTQAAITEVGKMYGGNAFGYGAGSVICVGDIEPYFLNAEHIVLAVYILGSQRWFTFPSSKS